MYNDRMAKYPKLRTGLALSGGSAWGVAHVGAIAALVEAGIQIDCIAGTSAGAVVAALYAFGLPMEKMADAAKKLEWKHISRFAYSRLGVRTNAALAKIIIGLIGDMQIEAAQTPLAIVATNIESGEEAVMRDGSVALAVRASSAIPGYFAPVEIDGQLYVDGFLTENLPLSALAEMGANFTIGVNLGGESPAARPRTMGDVIGRSLDILYRQNARNPENSPDVLIEPVLDQYHPRSFKEADKLYEEGYRAAQSAIPLLKAKLSIRKLKETKLLGRIRHYLRI
jgi:NTE family protein